MDEKFSIADQFTKYPGPRYRKDGPFSGEEFRDEILIPLLKKAKMSDGTVTVFLDGVSGYGSSFLEETFGGLLRGEFSYDDVQKHLKIVSNSDRFRHHVLRSWEYIRDEKSRQKGLK